MIVLSVLVILLVIFIIWYVIKKTIWVIRAAKLTANIPGPKPWPIIGNGLLLAKVKSAKETYKFMIDFFGKHGVSPAKMIKLWVGPKLIIIVMNPKYIETILTSPAASKKDSIYDFIGLVGNGLFVRNGREWQDLRKPLDKLLTKKKIESNLNMFHDKTIKLCKVLNKYADNGKSFNLRHYVTNFTIDVLCVSSFGYDLNEVENEKYNIFQLLERTIEAILQVLSHFLNVIYFPLVNISTSGKNLKELTRTFWKISCEILQTRIEYRKNLGDDIDDKQHYYADVLLQKAKEYQLTWEETGKLATDFLIAGFDTTAVTISYVLLMLAMFPEHQEAVYQEQIDILGDDPEVVPTWEQLSKMDYLTRIMKEVLRLFGPPGIFRELTNDLDLGEDYKLPEGGTTFISFYYHHRDPTLWLHPDKFYPDHFLPEVCAKRPKNTYIPFSWGPRACPGIVYAMTSNKIFVSAAIRKYKFETDLTFDQLIYKYSLLLEISHGYMVRIKSRS